MHEMPIREGTRFQRAAPVIDVGHTAGALACEPLLCCADPLMWAALSLAAQKPEQRLGVSLCIVDGVMVMRDVSQAFPGLWSVKVSHQARVEVTDAAC